MKRIISVILATTILFGLFTLAPISASAVTSGNYEIPIIEPLIKQLQNVNGGVEVTAKRINGAASFRFFRKTSATAWEELTDTTEPTYTDAAVKSGTTYFYSVRCYYPSGTEIPLPFDNNGKSIQYIAAPAKPTLANALTGVKVSWKSVTGAVKFRLFRKTASTAWIKLTDTKGLTYTDKTAKAGTRYYYTVRCITADGKKFTSAYDTTGKSIQYIAPPAKPTLKNTASGVKVSWKKSNGAAKYRLFRKTASSSWKKVTDTKGLTYTDKKVKMGTKYFYTVRCITADGKKFTSAYDTAGKNITYSYAPAKPKLACVVAGVRVSWKKSTGAAKYRLFRKTASSSWKKVTDTKGLTYTDKKVKSGTKYSYTLRCITADGKKTTSGFDKAGKTIKYIAAPANPSLKKTSAGVKVSWKKVNGAAKYRLFRKTASSSWKKITDTAGLSFVDKTVKAGVTYYYTLRCVTSNSKAFTSAYRSSGSKITIPMPAPKKSTNSGSAASGSLRSYIKQKGKTDSNGLKYISGNLTGDDFTRVTLQSDNALGLIYKNYSQYSDISVYINNIDTSKSNRADFKVYIYYGNHDLVLKTTGTINLTTSSSSLSSNNVTINYTKADKTYYTNSEAKHFTYSTLSMCLSRINAFLKAENGMTLRDIGIKSYPI